MRIIFFSDAHGNQYTIEAFFEMIKALSPDRAIFGGDVMGYYYGSDRIIDMLRENKVTCLLGNHDRMYLDVLDGERTEESLIEKYGNSYKNCKDLLKQENTEYLRTLSPRLDLDADGLHLTFVHGSVPDPLNGRVYPDAVLTDAKPYEGIDYVFAGHTHHKTEKHVGNTTIINPGSIGQQRDGKGCTFLLFDTASRKYEIHEVKYNIPDLVREIDQNEDNTRMHERLIEVLYRTPERRKTAK